MKNQNLVRLAETKRCGICGNKIRKGTLVQRIHTREREPEIICPLCLMRHKGILDEEKMYQTPYVNKDEKKGCIKYKRDKNRGIV